VPFTDSVQLAPKLAAHVFDLAALAAEAAPLVPPRRATRVTSVGPNDESWVDHYF